MLRTQQEQSPSSSTTPLPSSKGVTDTQAGASRYSNLPDSELRKSALLLADKIRRDINTCAHEQEEFVPNAEDKLVEKYRAHYRWDALTLRTFMIRRLAKRNIEPEKVVKRDEYEKPDERDDVAQYELPEHEQDIQHIVHNLERLAEQLRAKE